MKIIAPKAVFIIILFVLTSCYYNTSHTQDPLMGLALNSNYHDWNNHVDSLKSINKFFETEYSDYQSYLVNKDDSLSVVYLFNSDGINSGNLRDVMISLNSDITSEWGFRFIADTIRIKKFEEFFNTYLGLPDTVNSITMGQSLNEPYSSGKLSTWNKNSINAQLFISSSEEFDQFEMPVYRNVWFRTYISEFDKQVEQERKKYIDRLTLEDYVTLRLNPYPQINSNYDPQFDIYIGYILEGISRDRKSWYDFRTVSEVAITIFVEDNFGREMHREDFEYPISSGLQSGFYRYQSLYNVNDIGNMFTGAGVLYLSENILAQTAINSKHPNSSKFIDMKNNPTRYNVRYEIDAIAFTNGTYLNRN